MDSSSLDISGPTLNLGKTDKPFNFFMFIIVILIFFIIIIPWDKLKQKNTKEGMTGGTLTQLFANDSQDVYLKTNVDKLATGNFDLFWNQPTRIANTFQNRGTPLPTFILPDTQMNPNNYPIVASNNYTDYILNQSAKIPNNSTDFINPNLNPNPNPNLNSNTKKSTGKFPNPLIVQNSKSYAKNKISTIPTIPNNVLPSSLPMPSNPNNPPNPYELAFVAKQVAKTEQQANNLPVMTQWKDRDYLYQTNYDNLLYNKDCIRDPASCGGGAGGFRLGEDFVQATKAKPFVSISGDYFYPDSYVGSYFIEPNFDIVKPYPYMPNSNLPPVLD